MDDDLYHIWFRNTNLGLTVVHAVPKYRHVLMQTQRLQKIAFSADKVCTAYTHTQTHTQLS